MRHTEGFSVQKGDEINKTSVSLFNRVNFICPEAGPKAFEVETSCRLES